MSMRRLIGRIRIIIASVAFIVVLAVFGSFGLYVRIAYGRLRGDAPSVRRRRIGSWQAAWARLWYLFCRVIGGVRITYEFDESMRSAIARGPFIIVSNHFGAFDGLVIAEILRRVGCPDFRPVAKRQVNAIPIMGRVWKELGAAFVERDHRRSDADAVSVLADIAREDGASVIIFPEGTVLTAAKAVRGARTLLPPKLGGFRRLVRALPDRPILSLTMYWRDFAPYVMSDEGLVPPGRDVLVECRIVAPLAVSDADRALLEEWHRKESWLMKAE
jgi:1-acyl-sn-glycerol-3-phosphate acyltransferase